MPSLLFLYDFFSSIYLWNFLTSGGFVSRWYDTFDKWHQLFFIFFWNILSFFLLFFCLLWNVFLLAVVFFCCVHHSWLTEHSTASAVLHFGTSLWTVTLSSLPLYALSYSPPTKLFKVRWEPFSLLWRIRAHIPFVTSPRFHFIGSFWVEKPISSSVYDTILSVYLSECS